MFTLTFIALKLIDVLILNWWWIIVAMILDLYIGRMKEEIYLKGYEEGKRDRSS